MNITDEMISHTAQLAKIELSERDRERLAADLSSILEHVDKLKSVDTTAVEPTNQVTSLTNRSEDDVVRPYADTQALLATAHDVVEGYVKVKQVLP